MNVSTRLALIAALAVVWPVSGLAKEHVRDATVCQIVSHLRAFDGKMIRVRGLVVEGLEWFFLKSGDCRLDLALPKGDGELGPMATYMPSPEPRTRAKFDVKRDENYNKLVKYVSVGFQPCPGFGLCLGCDRYEVTATLTGLVEASKWGQPGFGHMNMGSARLVIRSVGDVAPVDISNRFRAAECPPILKMPKGMYPGWDLPTSVPPYPSPGSNPK